MKDNTRMCFLNRATSGQGIPAFFILRGTRGREGGRDKRKGGTRGREGGEEGEGGRDEREGQDGGRDQRGRGMERPE